MSQVDHADSGTRDVAATLSLDVRQNEQDSSLAYMPGPSTQNHSTRQPNDEISLPVMTGLSTQQLPSPVRQVTVLEGTRPVLSELVPAAAEPCFPGPYRDNSSLAGVYPFDTTLMDLSQDIGIADHLPPPGDGIDLEDLGFDWNFHPPWGTDWIGLDQDVSIAQTMFPQPLCLEPSMDPSSQTSPALPQQLDLAQASGMPLSTGSASPGPQMDTRQRSYDSSPRLRRPGVGSSSKEADLLEGISAVLSNETLPTEISLPQHSTAILHLEKLINIYFAEFHFNLPAIHKPTWDIMKCPTYLVAALACLGATSYHKKGGLDDESSLLAEICSRHLNKAVCFLGSFGFMPVG